MGWDVVDSGFQVVLAGNVAEIVADSLPPELKILLDENALSGEELSFYVGHPGGPRVLQAAEAALALPKGALAASWESLARFGNMSSTSVLFVLDEAIKTDHIEDSLGVMFAFGPAFCAEIGLLRVQDKAA
jgi:alkylresorcinol/alkylpyrone synthase